MFNRFFLPSAALVVGAFLITADAHAQSMALPRAGNGVTVRTLPNPNTPAPSIQTQSQALPGNNYFNANSALSNPRQPQNDFSVHGPYVGLKWVGNVK